MKQIANDFLSLADLIIDKVQLFNTLIYETYFCELFALGFYLFKNEDKVADVTQSFFEKIVLNPKKVIQFVNAATEDSFPGYLFAAYKNYCFEIIRKEKKEPVHVELSLDFDCSICEYTKDRSDIRESIIHILRQANVSDREQIVFSFYLQGYTPKEIANLVEFHRVVKDKPQAISRTIFKTKKKLIDKYNGNNTFDLFDLLAS